MAKEENKKTEENKKELSPEEVRKALDDIEKAEGIAKDASKKAEENNDSKAKKALEAIKAEINLIKQAMIHGLAKYDDLILLKKMIFRLRAVCITLGVSCFVLGIVTAIGLKRRGNCPDAATAEPAV